MINRDFWTNERIGQLSRDARLLLVALNSYADGEGKQLYNINRIKQQVFRYDSDVNQNDIESLIDELVQHGFVSKYSIDNVTYLQINSIPTAPLQVLDSIMPGRVTAVDRDWLYDLIDTYGQSAVMEALHTCKRMGSEVRSVRRFVEAVAARIKNEGGGKTSSRLSQDELDMLERARRRTKMLREQGVL